MKLARRGTPDLARVVEAALREAEAHEKVEAELCAALEAGDDALALQIARRLVGLPAAKKAS